MQTGASYLSIKEETTTTLKLESPNRRWLFLVFMLLFMAMPTLLLVMFLQDGTDQMVGIVIFAISLLLSLSFLLFTAFHSEVVVLSDAHHIVLERSYWFGFGTLGRKREKSWSFDDVTKLDVLSVGVTKRVDIEINGKKEFILGFSPRTKEDAQRFYDIFQSWLSGLTPDSPEALEVLDEIENTRTTVNSLKSVEKMLYFFGVISVLSGGMDLVMAWAVEQNQFATDLDFGLSISSIITFFVGIIYLACGYGARKRSEISLWIAMLVVISERAYEFFKTRSLGGEQGGASILVWLFAFFIVSTLWKAIQSIRTLEENPNSQILE